MKPALFILPSCLSLALALAHCNRPSTAAITGNSAAAKVERGRHLVENVGLCADCHSPRLPTGEFDKSKWMAGSLLAFNPAVPMPWAPLAPPLAGLPTLPTDEQAVEFLMTGRRPSGTPVLPPMPAYRLSREEAEAVVAYLRGLKPAG